jgi:phage terminase small subunit
LAPPLKREHQLFVDEYLLDLDAKKAAIRAGYANGASAQHLINREDIQDAIAREKRRRIGRTDVYADKVLQAWWLLGHADVNEVVQLRRVCCPSCHGDNHEAQMTPDGLRRAQLAHAQTQLKLPEKARTTFNQFDDGYDRNKPVYSIENGFEHNCPECHGDGEIFAYFNDSRTLSPAGKQLFNGVEVRADGSVKVLLRDRDHALEMVAQHLGMKVGMASATILQQNNTVNVTKIERVVVDPGRVVIDGTGGDGADSSDPDSEGLPALTGTGEV